MPDNVTQDKFSVGLVQMSSSNQRAENMISAEAMIRLAAAEGAGLVMTPEMTPLLELDRKALLGKIYTEDEDPSLVTFRALARELKIWLMIGSMAVRPNDDQDEKIANRCYVIAPDGAIAARYDKIHMFDVDLPSGEQYRESRSYQPGEAAVVTALPWGRAGLSICYDVRFPQLYRKLAQAGAVMLTVPAAFTRVTGEAHWHVLLRARAIENGAYVFAPAQTGRHVSATGESRETYGHSLLIDPWGNIMDDGGTETGVIVAEIDLGLVKKVRSRVPSLDHDRSFELNR